MTVKCEINNFYELMCMVWSGAKDTLNIIANNNKTEDFMEYLNSEYDYNDSPTPTMTELNDWLWFDRDNILADLDIDYD